MGKTYKLSLPSSYDEEYDLTTCTFMRKLNETSYSKGDVLVTEKDIDAYISQNGQIVTRIEGPGQIKVGKIAGIQKPFFGKVDMNVCYVKRCNGLELTAKWEKDDNDIMNDKDKIRSIDRHNPSRTDKFSLEYTYSIKYKVVDDFKLIKHYSQYKKPDYHGNFGEISDDSHALDELIHSNIVYSIGRGFAESKFIKKGWYNPNDFSEEEKSEISPSILKQLNFVVESYGLEIDIENSQITIHKFERVRLHPSRNDCPKNRTIESYTMSIGCKPYPITKYISEMEYTSFPKQSKMITCINEYWIFTKTENGIEKIKSIFSSKEIVDFTVCETYNAGVLNKEDKEKMDDGYINCNIYNVKTSLEDCFVFEDLPFVRPDGTIGGKISFKIGIESNSIDCIKAMEYILNNREFDYAGRYKGRVDEYPMNVLNKYVEKEIRANLWDYYDGLKYKFVENNLYERPKIVTSIIPDILATKILEQLDLLKVISDLTGYSLGGGDHWHPELIRLEFYK